MRLLLMALCLVLLAGCQAFEQTPDDVQKKLMDPTSGHLYEPDPMEGY